MLVSCQSISKIVTMTSRKEFTVENHSTTVLSKLDKQRNKKSFCDVILQVENTEFHAHRNLLSACSDYFYKMFTIDMKEKSDKTVILKDISSDALRSILEFFYTEKIVLTEENVSDIFYAASIMQIEDALEVIISYLSNVLNSGNCLYFRKLGHLHSLLKLVEETDQFILDHFEEISQQEAFYDLGAEELEKLFASEALKVDEEALVYEALVKWVNKDLEKRKSDYPKLFSNLRLQFVPLTYLASTIRKNKLVREFPDCRDLVEDAFFFHAKPEMVTAEKPRKSYGIGSQINSVICVPTTLCETNQLQVFYIETRSWDDAVEFDGWDLINRSSAVATNFHKSVFCGGMSGNNQALDLVIQFDGKRWNNLKSMRRNRIGGAATFYEDKLYVFGGEMTNLPHYHTDSSNNYNKNSFCRDFETYSGTWKTEGHLESRRSFAAAQALEKSIYLIGGYMFKSNSAYAQEQAARGYVYRAAQHGGYGEPSNTTNVYNVESGAWEDGPSMNTARAYFGAATLNSTIYVFGGSGTDNVAVNGSECLDLKSKVWTSINPPCTLGLGYGSACLVNDQVFIVTGNGCMLSFDPENKQWKNDGGNRVVEAGSYVIPYASKTHG